MREIKFRTWLPKTQEMIVPYGIIWVDGHRRTYETRDSLWKNDMCLEELNEKHILMQFTGLKDKNGKEIYEGDILEHQYRGKGQVIYETPCFRVRGDDTDIFLGHIAEKHRKVIGNIHENPELLK